MLTASRSLRKAAAAEPLPGVPALWRLTQDGVCLRRGELVMIVGVPNSGKSAFMLWYAASLNKPSLYFSADNNAHTSLTRLLSFVTQTERRNIENDLDDHDTGDVMEDFYSAALKDSNLQFVFDGSLTLKAVTAELNAYVEIYDEWPELIVVDNLINVEDTSDHAGQSGILSELHMLARVTGATVFVLHHASESNQQRPTKAPPRAAVQNKVTQLPDLVLSVAADSLTGDFEVAAIKVRGGTNDPSAQRPYLLYADLAKCTFYADSPQLNWSPSGWCNDDE